MRMFERQQHGYESFIVLASATHSGLTLNPQALQLIQNTLDGPVALVTMEGAPSCLFRHFLRDNSRNQGPRHAQSCIMMSTRALSDHKTTKQYYLMETYANSEQDRVKLHLLAASISTLIIVNAMTDTNLSFLAALNGRCVISQQRDGSLHGHVASILALTRGGSNSPQNQMPLRDTSQDFTNFLQMQNLREYVTHTYDFLGSYWMPDDSQTEHLTENVFENLFSKFILGYKDKENADLMNGPVLRSYTENIVSQLNRTGFVIYEKAENDIEVDEGYEAYTKAVDFYHEISRQNFRNQAVFDVQNVCTNNRRRAEESFNQMSSDSRYLTKLHEYITHKEHQIRFANNELHDERNLQILRRQSDDLIHKVKHAKSQNKDLNFVKGDLDTIVAKYERDAGGDNKHKLLTEYLNTFTANIYGDDTGSKIMVDKQRQRQIQKMLDKRNQENKLLKTRIKQMEKRKKGCCQIM